MTRTGRPGGVRRDTRHTVENDPGECHPIIETVAEFPPESILAFSGLTFRYEAEFQPLRFGHPCSPGRLRASDSLRQFEGYGQVGQNLPNVRLPMIPLPEPATSGEGEMARQQSRLIPGVRPMTNAGR